MVKNKVCLISLFLALYFLFSCKTGNSERNLPAIHLKGTILQPDSILLGHKVVAIVDSHLVVPTWKNEYLYDVYKMKGDSLLLNKS